jgi:hypothetical protein
MNYIMYYMITVFHDINIIKVELKIYYIEFNFFSLHDRILLWVYEYVISFCHNNKPLFVFKGFKTLNKMILFSTSYKLKYFLCLA